MKPEEEEILERNLTALFARAYRPVRADPRFLADLERRFLEGVAARGVAEVAAPHRHRWTARRLGPLGAGLAAALALLALTPLWPRSCGGTGTSSPNGAVAQSDRAATPALGANSGANSVGEPNAPTAGLAPRRPAVHEEVSGPTASPHAGPSVEKPAPAATEGAESNGAPARLHLTAQLPPGADRAGFEVALVEQRGWPEVVVPRRFALLLDDAQRAEPLELAAGAYELFARAPGAGAFGPLELELLGGADHVETLVLAAPRTLSGRVHDARGDGIAGANLLLESATPPRAVDLDPALWHELLADFAPHTTSGPDGRFVLAGVPPGNLVLRVHAPGHGPRWLRVPEGADTLEVELGAFAQLGGRVDAPNGGPWVDAVVVAVQLEDPGGTSRAAFRAAVVDHSGRYRLDGLPGGYHVVLLLAPGAAPDEVRAMRYVELETGRTDELDFAEASPAARLSGRLVDANGAPVVGRSLGLWRDGADPAGTLGGNWVAAVSDADGRFGFADLAPGPWTLFSSTALESHIAALAWLTLERSADRSLELTLPSGRLELGAAQQGEGPRTVVLWRTDDSGEVRFAGRANTVEQGPLEIGPLPPGTYRIEVYGRGGPLGQATATVHSGPTKVELTSAREAAPVETVPSTSRASDAQDPPKEKP